MILIARATEHYPTLVQKTIAKGESVDWTQWRRTVVERLSPTFPSNKPERHILPTGALVIGGGGGMPLEVWQRFVRLAGGEQSHIVLLPTAVDQPNDLRGLEHRMLTAAGAGTIETLAQYRLPDVTGEDFLSRLDRATGVWFGGGRQWRFVDAYWGTPAWEKIRDVCRRGGVVGGSSAGATIQGDLLLRGSPDGNHIMLADGYRRGLGILPAVAIDQHFAQRNRFRDLEECLASFPTIYGIGLDEQTALIVTAPNHAEVLGHHSVWCYPSRNQDAPQVPRSQTLIEYKSGDRFLLAPLSNSAIIPN